MEILLIVNLSIIVNAVIGSLVLTALDGKDERFYNWYKTDPSAGIFGFVVLELWPVFAYFILKDRFNK